MRNSKFNKVIERTVMRLLDRAVQKYGLPVVRHAANKWCTAQREKIRFTKQKAALERQLTDVNRRLST